MQHVKKFFVVCACSIFLIDVNYKKKLEVVFGIVRDIDLKAFSISYPWKTGSDVYNMDSRYCYWCRDLQSIPVHIYYDLHIIVMTQKIHGVENGKNSGTLNGTKTAWGQISPNPRGVNFSLKFLGILMYWNQYYWHQGSLVPVQIRFCKFFL